MPEGTLAAAIVAECGVGGDGHTLAIVADRQLSVAALVALLVRDQEYRLVQQVRGVREIRQSLEDFHPAVVIIDAKWSEHRSPVDTLGCNEDVLILLDPEDDPAVFVQAAGARARGYLSRSARRQALHEAIDRVRSADYYLDAAIAGRILGAIRQSGTAIAPRNGLSEREREILIRVASGRSTKEIGREYAITPKTVGNHVTNIYRKLNLRHRGDLVLYAAQQGLSLSSTPPSG
jgi:DNA-binding NarL/FixJ family response regulator